MRAGLNLADLAGAEVPAATPMQGDSSFGRAKSCIVLFLMGGPPQHSTWDPKPDAPAEVRGDLGPISTTVPGLSICELMPKTAMIADKLCLLRAVSTQDNAHSSSGYYMLTGRPHQPMNFENANPGPPNDAAWPRGDARSAPVRSRRLALVDHVAQPDRQYRRQHLAGAGCGIPGAGARPLAPQCPADSGRVSDTGGRPSRGARPGSDGAS